MNYRLKLFTLLLFISMANSSWSQQSVDIASNYLIQNQSKNKQVLTKDNLVVSSSHTSQQSGLTHVYFNQAVNGIKIYNAITNVAVDKAGTVFYTGNRFVDYLSVEHPSPAINALSAIQRTATHFNLDDNNQTTFVSKETGSSNKSIYTNESLSEREIVTELIYVHQKGKLILCWGVAIEKSDDHFYWDVKVSASTGEIVEKTSWTVECNFDHGQDACDHSNHSHTFHETTTSSSTNQVTSKKSMVADGDYSVIPMPFESPNHGPISVVNSPWLDNIDAAAHPLDWHDDGVSTHYTTRGNNVWAVEDTDQDDNQNAGFSPSSEMRNIQSYNYIPDFSLAPPDYQEAAIVNLFYWNNLTHDVMYHYGFDEVSGNFQETNVTGSGAGSDGVQADAQDGSGNNNANFSTPPDGSNPRMQMFQWVSDPVSTFDVTSTPNASYFAVAAAFGPIANFAGTVVDAFDTTGGTQEACTTNPIANGAAISGNIALIDRGNCTFVEKVTNAEAEGAIAVVICNNIAGDAPFSMNGTAPFPSIPSVMLSQADCITLRSMLPADINVTTVPGAVNRDSDYDNGVIVHEYGHGISTRLTGGAGSSGCLGGDEQMGEGWSDFFGLVMTMQAGDAGTDARGIGTYLQFEPTNGPGIRPYEYSTDFAINPMTYGYTDDGGAITIPHGVGSVWCTMLWEMTWDLIDIYGIGTNIYDSDINNAGTAGSPSSFGGQNLALQLVIEGLKLQPCGPGFVDGRDAILAADDALYGGIHKCVIWQAFARRGLGPDAVQGSSASLTDNIESFDYSPIVIQKTVDAPVVAKGGTATYTIEVSTCATETNIVVTDNLDPAFTISSMVCPSPAVITNNGNAITITHPSLPAETSFSCDIIVTSNPTGGAVSNLLDDDVESGNIGWTFDNIQGAATDQWAIVNTASNSPSNSWFIADTDGPDRTHALESPVLAFGQNPSLVFSHSFDTEADWDGGFVEISTDNGASWQALDPNVYCQNGYNSILGTNQNAYIAEQPAWSGNSNGFIETIALLDDYSNQNVILRFVYGQDDNTNETGWWIDDISVALNQYGAISNIACMVSDQTATAICSEVVICAELDEAQCIPEYTATNSNMLTGVQTTTVDFETNGVIESDQTIQGSPSINVDYDSGTHIEMMSGFEVELSSIFHAFIDGCGGAQ